MKPSKACIKHCRDLLNPKHIFTKQQINAIVKMANGVRYGEDASQNKINGRYLVAALDLRETKDIVNKITPEQTKKGKEWLQNILLKRSYGFKKGSGFEWFNNHPSGDHYIGLVKRVKQFHFVGLMGLSNGMGEYCFAAAIYTIEDGHGHEIEYAPLHWSPAQVAEQLERFHHYNVGVTVEELRSVGIVE